MIDLEKFYNDRVKGLGSSEQLEQVGHTVNGKAISNMDFEHLTNLIKTTLKLTSNDRLLDLCCGNGIITKQLSKNCESVYAVDLSGEMINVAEIHNKSNNIEYHSYDILNINNHLPTKTIFSKVVMFGALQHFDKKQLSNIIQTISCHCDNSCRILFGFIPDTEKKWQFYDSIFKKINYFQRRLFRSDVMGTWWEKEYIKKISNQEGFTCEFISINEEHYGYPYRFHAILHRHSVT